MISSRFSSMNSLNERHDGVGLVVGESGLNDQLVGAHRVYGLLVGAMDVHQPLA